MKPYLYALGAILCWASLPAATGGGLDGLSVPELLFFSFVPAVVYLFVQEMLLARRPRIPWPDMKGSVLRTVLKVFLVMIIENGLNVIAVDAFIEDRKSVV